MTAGITPTVQDEAAHLLAAFLCSKGPKGEEIIRRWLRRRRWRAGRTAGGAV